MNNHRHPASKHTSVPSQRQHIEDEEGNRKLTPRSQYRYRPIQDFIDQAEEIEMDDGTLYRQGADQIYQHNGPPPIPVRAGRYRTTTAQYALPAQAASLKPARRRRSRWLFWLLIVGLVLLVMILGNVGLGALGTWWQNHQNDAQYGYPRTFQIDAVVGHDGDSPDHPSHFIALNLHGHIVIIEIPGGNVSKSLIYSGPTLVGPGQDLTPVTLSFQEELGSRGPAMLVHIESTPIIWLNNGAKFLAPSSTGG